MSHPLLRRSKARRGLQTRVTSAAEAEAFSDDSGLRSIVTHGLAALAISALGLGVLGSVGLTASAQSEDVSARSSLSADSPDVTRAEPAVQAKDLNKDTQAAIQQPAQASTDENTNGALEAFDRRKDTVTRNAVRSGLDGALAVEQSKERNSTLAKSDTNVSESSRRLLQGARASDLKSSQAAIATENKRLTEEKKKKEKEAAEKEKAGGTLTKPDTPAAAPETSDTTEVSGSGGASPLAKGKYSIAARWGAVGSWARYHTGIDLSAPIGTPIHAAADGTVQGPAAGAGWAGTHVVLGHSGGAATLYAHMARTTVSAGQQVKAGDVIGYVGMTGRTFGPHLHFEYYPAGSRPGDVYSNKDPYAWMLTKGVKL